MSCSLSKVAIIAPRDEPGLRHVMMTMPLANPLTRQCMVFEKSPLFVELQANQWAHHGGA